VALFRGLTIRGVTEEVMMSPRGDAPLPPVLYRLTWREVPRPRDPRVLARHWCVLDDETGVGARLAEHLRAEGCAAHVISAESLEVDSACLIEAASFETLLQHLGDESVGIVYLWTLKTPTSPRTPFPRPPTPSPPELALGCSKPSTAGGLSRTGRPGCGE
jgi:hypothetical protein